MGYKVVTGMGAIPNGMKMELFQLVVVNLMFSQHIVTWRGTLEG
jgi:hypothetical protein